jgi:hypothetical protein
MKKSNSNGSGPVGEFVYFNRETTLPSFLAGAVKKYTAGEASTIAANLAETMLDIRPVTALDRVMLKLGREAVKSCTIHLATFKGRKGYHEHLNGVRGFVAVPREGGGEPQCFREDGSPMYVYAIEGELKYLTHETVWPAEVAAAPPPKRARKGGARNGKPRK